MEVFSSGGAFSISGAGLFNDELKISTGLGDEQGLANGPPAIAVHKEIDTRTSDTGYRVNGVDVFIDNTGQATIIEMGYAITKPQGRVTLVGVPRNGNNINLYSLPLHFGKGLAGSHGGEAIPHLDIPRYQNLFCADRIRLRELLTERLPLEDINTAIENIRSGKTSGRCLVKM